MNTRIYLLFSLVLLLAVGACSDPASPRFPEPPEEEEDDPDDDQTGLQVTFLRSPTLV